MSSLSDFESEQVEGEPLTMEHRRAIEVWLDRLRYGLSEYCFANLYLFKEVHQYRLVQKPFPFLLGITYDGERHAMPLIPLMEAQLESLFGQASCIYPLPQEIIRSIDASKLDISWNEDDSDYLYEAAKLSRLAGARLRSKRNQAERFSRVARPVVLTLSEDNAQGAHEVLDIWVRQLPAGRANTDRDACARALTHFKELGLEGILVTDGAFKNYGFLITSRLPDGTLAVHFAKGDRDCEGVYPFMFSQLGARTARGYLNFEQDLGSAGLRQAKRALDPASRLHKYRLRRRAPAGEVFDRTGNQPE